MLIQLSLHFEMPLEILLPDQNFNGYYCYPIKPAEDILF